MTVLLASLAALTYGVADFIGGVASRRRSAITVLLTGYPVGAVAMLACLPLVPGSLTVRCLLFGIAGGICGMTGVVVFYSAMQVAPLNVVAPVSGVSAAAVPVLFGVIGGERPSTSAWAGIALGLLAVVLVSRTPQDHPHGPIALAVVGFALLGGVGFGGYFVLLDHAGHGTGAWPVIVSRITSSVLIVPLALRRRQAGAISGRLLPLVVLMGVCDASANLFFLLAARHGYLSLAGVITSLYPVATVVLAIVVLGERTGRLQRVGLGLAATAIALITY